MNIKKVYADNDLIGYQCGNCGTIYKEKSTAEQCCKPFICEKCGKEICRDRTKGLEAYYINPTRCGNCYRQDKWNEMPCISEKEYLSLCKEDDHYGPVFWGDNPYTDLYEALECELSDYDNIEDVPNEIELGYWHKMEPVDIESILCNELDNAGIEDWTLEDCYKDVKELIDFVKQWNEKQTSYVYYSSAKKKVHISDETLQEYWEDING